MMSAKSKSSSTAPKPEIDREDDEHASPSSLSDPFEFNVSGGSGADSLYAALSLRSHLSGGSGNDALFGGNMGDWLAGDSGSDALFGGAGNDRLNGDSGNDSLTGGRGNDLIDGGSGWDSAFYSGSVLDYHFSKISHSEESEQDDHLISVADQRMLDNNDGTDTVRKVEELYFSDRTIYLDGRNNTPYAVADNGVTDEDAKLVFTATTLLGNDWDFEGDYLSLSAVTAVAHGTVSLDPAGNVIFFPDSNFSGTASFSYTISDGHGGQDTGIFQVKVNAVADAPMLSVSLPDALPASGFAHAAQMPVIMEAENNDTQALATQISRSAFAIAANADLTDQSDPSVSIHGIIASAADKDFYQFSFKAGEKVIFDIDYGKPDVDTVIFLYDASGKQLATNDDVPGTAHPLSIDHGSMSFLDSYLTYTFATDGEYSLMVKPYRTGGDYQLNVSIDDATAVSAAPQPFAIGINAALLDTDGSESVSVTLFGLPEGALLSAGTYNQDGSWTLLPPELPELMLTLPPGVDHLNLVVDATSTESENGSSAHHVIGSSGSDLIRGGVESDIFTGGAGSDRFAFDTISRHADRITDFQTGPGGDLLDFRGILAGNAPGGPAESYVHTEITDAGTMVSVAQTGASGVFQHVVVLVGVFDVTGADLAAQGNLWLF